MTVLVPFIITTLLLLGITVRSAILARDFQKQGYHEAALYWSIAAFSLLAALAAAVMAWGAR